MRVAGLPTPVNVNVFSCAPIKRLQISHGEITTSLWQNLISLTVTVSSAAAQCLGNLLGVYGR